MAPTLAVPRKPSPTESPEFKAALAAQIDYDSTAEGMSALDATLRDLLASTGDGQRSTAVLQAAQGLVARKVAGEHARKFRREQVAMMPARVLRGEAHYREYQALAEARERLARELACAAAETNAWSQPSPMTASRVLALYDEVYEIGLAAGFSTESWCHPRVFASVDVHDLAPWLGSPYVRPVTVGDVMAVAALGMKASWREGRVYATGNPDAMFRWGYSAQVDSAVSIIATGPDLHGWAKAQVRS